MFRLARTFIRHLFFITVSKKHGYIWAVQDAIFLFVYDTEQHSWMYQNKQMEFGPVCCRLFKNEYFSLGLYEGCPESILTFWLSREPVAWRLCNMAASQGRPYCASVNSESLVGLVSRQWDAVYWACELCDRRIHKSPPPFQRGV